MLKTSAPTEREQLAALRAQLVASATDPRSNVIDRIAALEAVVDGLLRVAETRTR